MGIASGALPPAEKAVLDAAIGQTCTSIALVGMKGCDEGYLSSQEVRGFHEVTWGVVLGLDGSSLGITWGEDSHGDPFRIALAGGELLGGVESAAVQEVSELQPWRCLLGTALSSARVHTYLANYRPDSWVAVPWGIELVFGNETRLLVAAVHHKGGTSARSAADEIVLIWSAEQINSVCQAYDHQAVEWRVK